MSNLHKGGAFAVGLSVCVYLSQLPSNNIYLIVSDSLAKEIKKNNLNVPNLINHNYSWRSFIFLNKLIREKKIDSVLTLFGPILWRPRVKHIVGFALPWLIYDTSAVRTISTPLFYIRKKIESYVKSLVYVFSTDKYIVESDDVKLNLSSRLKIKTENISVVSNSYNQFFKNAKKNNNKNPNKTQILYISAYYPHKNFVTLLKAINLLNAQNNNHVYEVVLTIPNDNLDKLGKYCDAKYILNKGYVSPSEIPKLYVDCDIVVSSSLLECFSAIYVEAIFMNKPLIVSDFSFSRTICKKAALYFEALSYKHLAEQVLKIQSDSNLREELSYNCRQLINEFPSSNERARKYIEILNES